MKRSFAILTVAFVLAAVAPRAAGAEIQCAEFAALASSSLPPQVGEPGLVGSMLSGAGAFAAQGLSRSFDPKLAARALGSRLRPARSCPRSKDRKRAPRAFECDYSDPRDPRVSLDVEMPEGRITFLDPGRRFDPEGPDNDVTDDAALTVGRELLLGLGVPAAEIDPATAEADARMLASRPTDLSAPPSVRRIEVVALFERIVNGFPVIDSKAGVVVDVNGRAARAHVVWPDFSLAPGLAGATPRPRPAVVAEIARTLGEIAGTCQSFDRMLVQVGWIPAELPDPGDAAGPAGRYAPGLRVIVAPPEQPEDAAAPGDFVQSFLVPLVADGGEG